MHLVHKLIFSLLICAAAVSSELYQANSEIVKPDQLHNTCGGVLEVKQDEMVSIEYKPDEEYDNDEFCVWEVRRVSSLMILISKITSGFELGYDYLQISTFENGSPSGGHYKMGNTTGIEQILVNQPNVLFVIFSTDYSNKGTGFRVEFAGYMRGSSKDLEDFVYFSPIGSATLRPYHSWMSRSYLIVPPLKSVDSLVLDLEFMTADRSDYLTVYSMERNGQSVNFRQHANRLSGNGTASFQTDYYANFIVFFESDSVGGGGGYELNWYVPDSPTTESYA